MSTCNCKSYTYAHLPTISHAYGTTSGTQTHHTHTGTHAHRHTRTQMFVECRMPRGKEKEVTTGIKPAHGFTPQIHSRTPDTYIIKYITVGLTPAHPSNIVEAHYYTKTLSHFSVADICPFQIYYLSLINNYLFISMGMMM